MISRLWLLAFVAVLPSTALGQGAACRQSWMPPDQPTFCNWRIERPLPERRTYHATVNDNGNVYVLGGYLFDAATGNLTYYSSAVSSKIGPDGRVGEWMQQPAFVGGRSGAGATAAAGCLFLSGGSSSGLGTQTYFNDVQSARIADDGSLSDWNVSANHLKTARSNHSLVAARSASGTLLYAVAGVTQTGNDTVHLDTVEIAEIGPDCSVGEWKTGNYHLKGGRSTPSALVLRGSLAIFGGWGDLDTIDVFSDVQMSPLRPDGSLGPWRTASRPLPTGLYGSTTLMIESADRSRASLLLTVGGQVGSGAYANWIGHAYLFPTTDASEAVSTWRIASTGRLPSARAGLGAFEWHGRIYAIGGTDAGGGFLPDVLSAEYDSGRP